VVGGDKLDYCEDCCCKLWLTASGSTEPICCCGRLNDTSSPSAVSHISQPATNERASEQRLIATIFDAFSQLDSLSNEHLGHRRVKCLLSPFIEDCCWRRTRKKKNEGNWRMAVKGAGPSSTIRSFAHAQSHRPLFLRLL
jgi:hypothetical protein